MAPTNARRQWPFVGRPVDAGPACNRTGYSEKVAKAKEAAEGIDIDFRFLLTVRLSTEP